ncbi:hypothetical protein [Pedobacter mucosus]|uniref:hypothetical protein n=1 Tax=Pedobacter mucosus TaxID=2895286 RepID=UPI001EE4EA4F|nr:hypothetical protein [Pedobacter mucosus]UKT65963.1 hypothetical protein LOK61_09250 [Pedobacter mucosus]
MKKYQASTELIDILLKNGFIENTIITYPLHAARLKGDNYDAQHMKRHFVFVCTRENVLFDYINMRFPGQIGASSLDTAELKSLITYCKLSSSDRATLKAESYHSLSVHKLLGESNISKGTFQTISKITSSFVLLYLY